MLIDVCCVEHALGKLSNTSQKALAQRADTDRDSGVILAVFVCRAVTRSVVRAQVINIGAWQTCDG